ncbi:hypothetical protein ACFV6F_29785 [Kitasatospora phosalacinea]|uniref:hypothetical protein n=1 Tax=Kitasatospora phosalacinea TaxID=2065 RepID=UPI00365DF3AA
MPLAHSIVQFLHAALADPSGPQAQQLRDALYVARAGLCGARRVRALLQLRAAARPAPTPAPVPPARPCIEAPAADRTRRTVVVRPARRRTHCCCRR